jgi:methenyltetrahydrofolate cyclohydrolase
MPMLTDKTLTQLLDAFASSDPTPGGGSASALSGAIGSSLAMMVAALPKTRTNSDAERSNLRAAHQALLAQRDRLTALIDRDAAAYEQVVSAYRMPKDTDEQKAIRRETIQRALRAATDVPLEVMRVSVTALEAARDVARDAHRAAASDVGVAIALLESGIHGAGLNVRINLDGLADRSAAADLAREAGDLEQRRLDVAHAARELLGS